MNVWLDAVHTNTGVIRNTNEDVLWIQATVLGVRVCKDDGVRLYPWHRIHLCVESD